MSSLIERDAEAFLHQTGSSPVEKTFRAVEGVWAEDHSGHRFMDFQGNTCHNIGYRHPRLIQALKDQLDVLPFTPRGFTNEPAVALAEWLSELWPYGKGRVLLGLSGADAIEMALKLAYVATGRLKTLAFEDSWHGAALGAIWAGGRESERRGLPRFEGCHHVPPFWGRRRGESDSGAAEAALQAIKSHLAQGDFACFLAEPIRSTPCIPPDWSWPEVRRLCDTSGTLLIFDEFPTGLG
jgi:4-aminobutyrate aminotransferase